MLTRIHRYDPDRWFRLKAIKDNVATTAGAMKAGTIFDAKGDDARDLVLAGIARAVHADDDVALYMGPRC